MEHLFTLSLVGNRIKVLPDSFGSDLSELISLNLSNNNISDISSLKTSPSVVVNVRDQQIFLEDAALDSVQEYKIFAVSGEVVSINFANLDPTVVKQMSNNSWVFLQAATVAFPWNNSLNSVIFSGQIIQSGVAI